MKFLDSHSHIFSEEFQDDLAEVLARAKEKEVERIVIITTEAKEARKAMAFAEQDPNRFQVAYGIHPEDIGQVNDESLKEMKEIVQDERISFVGEIGLDYYWEKEKAEAQKELFIEQIKIAQEVGKPIMVHSRDAHQDTFDILNTYQTPGVMHCYSGSLELAKEYTKLGYYIALGGVVTFKNARQAKEVCVGIDKSFLLSETDCPYMAPEPVRGTRNEPSNIPYIVEKMAELNEWPLEKMAEQIWQNGQAFLGATK